jgi:hypothetical protein
MIWPENVPKPEAVLEYEEYTTDYDRNTERRILNAQAAPVFSVMDRADAALAACGERIGELEAELAEARYRIDRMIEDHDGTRAELAALKARRCETCLHWERHTYDDDGTCTSTLTYRPDWIEDDEPPRTVEAIALWASNNEYSFHPPADFACNRWTARTEGGGEE